MLVTFGYYPGDQAIVPPLLEWMEELGGCHGHTLLLVHDARVPQLDVAAILARAKGIFNDVRDIPAPAAIDDWPMGGNYMFHIAATYLSKVRGLKQWLWIEPDAIPLKENWLDDLEGAYEEGGKPFMGDDVNVGDVPRHMSGVGVYPNPLVEFAGEAMRCHDLAWDMAAKDQIIPQAHFTELIEHAWKHPEFKSLDELTTQINPKTILFHASKDLSLIRLLREQRSRAQAVPTVSPQESLPADLAHSRGEPISPPLNTFPVPVPAEPRLQSQEIEGSGEARESTQTTAPKQVDGCEAPRQGDAVKQSGVMKPDSRGGETIYDIFIRTYPGDYNWLAYSLKSIHKYATGFRKIWIVSSSQTPFEPFFDPEFIEWKVLNEESEDGYLSQQIHKLYADAVTGYEADYYLHIDSDTLFTRPVTPEDFFTKPVGTLDLSQPKLIWYYTPYEHTETPWQPIIEKFIGHGVPHEFMRRLPMMVPRWLYAKLREYCFLQHKMIVSQYVRNQPYREFSEFNALGAYAWQYHHDEFHWVNTIETEMPAPFARQFYSWGTLEAPGVLEEIKEILSGKYEKVEQTKTILSGAVLTKSGDAVEAVPTQNFGPKNLISKTPTSFPNGEWQPSDHVHWLAEYVGESKNRRYQILTLLKQSGLRPRRKRRIVKRRKGRPVKNM